MQTLAEIRRLLGERGLRPKRALGQNFLIDRNLVARLVEASGVGAGDLVLEVGPGTGTLTEALLARGCEVVACELDDALAALLVERAPQLPGGDRLRVLTGDCLAGKRALAPAVAGALGGRAFALVANLPYGAATPLLLTLMLEHPACARMAVTIQREVADRMLAEPGTRDYGVLSVVARATGSARRLATLPPECFWPRPDVTSAMVVYERSPAARSADPRRLAGLCVRLFAQRRKQLGSVLAALDPEGVASARALGIDTRRRAETLSVEELDGLATALDRRPGGL